MDSIPVGICDDIHDLLFSLGVTSNYKGFFYISDATLLAILQPERLLFITKQIYPDVARKHFTTWSNVERDIRTVTMLVWDLCPDKLNHIANHKLKSRPSNSKFISLLANHIQDKHRIKAEFSTAIQ